MAIKISYSRINSFTKKFFAGNTAGVLMSDDLSEKEMLMIAHELNFAETAFISTSSICNYKLRWISPINEVDLCGHATIAALHFLKERNLLLDGCDVTFETRSGNLCCGLKYGMYFMEIPIKKIEEYKFPSTNIFQALQINKKYISNDLPFLIHDKVLFIAINSLEQLNMITPDFIRLYQVTDNVLFNSIMLFTLETNEVGNCAYSRFFAPFDGINEDIVTGSANGPLLLILLRLKMIEDLPIINCTFEQGDRFNRPGRVVVNYNQIKKKLLIMGDAVTVVRGEFQF